MSCLSSRFKLARCFTTAPCPSTVATISAVRSTLSGVLSTCCRSTRGSLVISDNVSTKPFCAATIAAVNPYAVFMFGSMNGCDRRACTTSAWPSLAAQCKAVWRVLASRTSSIVNALTSMVGSCTSTLTTLACPALAATINGVILRLRGVETGSTVFGSMPERRSFLTSSLSPSLAASNKLAWPKAWLEGTSFVSSLSSLPLFEQQHCSQLNDIAAASSKAGPRCGLYRLYQAHRAL
mmetsp:Transcript_51139/g.119831  ORF Transcript_51139/g.119831 Transcript_51139/m.119831 type:complete len:237 (-) Transcript_51139:24-734(-)